MEQLEVKLIEAGKKHGSIAGPMLYALEKELWDDPAAPLDISEADYTEAAERLIGSGGFWCFIAFAGDDTAGIATVSEKKAVYAGGCFGELMELYINPAFRGCGIGSALISRCTELAAERRWSILDTATSAKGGDGRPFEFYRKNGFSPVGPKLEITIK